MCSQERCKTLSMELEQRNELYSVLQSTHDELLEQHTQVLLTNPLLKHTHT